MRVAYNWALAEVRDNLEVRRDERGRGVPEDELTPALSWSRASLMARWRPVRDEVHPWWRDVAIHAFRTGIDNAARNIRAQGQRLLRGQPAPPGPGGVRDGRDPATFKAAGSGS